MSTPDTLLSHRQHIVSEIVHGDPEIADLLFELLVITDSSTSVGAAIHADVLHDLYNMSPESYAAFREKENRIKEASLEHSTV